MSYAGDIPSAEAWKILTENPRSVLIDVRTQAEWSFVGVPDLSSLGKEVLLVQWQVFPTMAQNDDFAAELTAKGIAKDQTLLFLCRSGVRSKVAAELMTLLGYRDSWNIGDGFEGGLDEARHRGRISGWKAAGLPWVQG